MKGQINKNLKVQRIINKFWQEQRSTNDKKKYTIQEKKDTKKNVQENKGIGNNKKLKENERSVAPVEPHGVHE